MGRRRSVYLSEADDGRLAALPTTLPEVIQAGLAALEGKLRAADFNADTERRDHASRAYAKEPGFETSALYPCCSHCTHPPTVSGHGRRCQHDADCDQHRELGRPAARR